jgi:hypothetical protein
MIQFNLLPDVKLEFVKARKNKHTVMSVSLIVALAALFILLIAVFFVYAVQKKSIRDLNSDITRYTSQIKNTPDLNKILTIQNQLNSLPRLETQKPAVGRLFSYITQLTPNAATISTLTLNFSTSGLTIAGEADSVATINQFVDTLKFTTYNIGTSSQTNDAFSNVVLTSYSLPNVTSGQTAANKASYDISASFSPTIFNASSQVTANVPNIISTRSETEQPLQLFNAPPTTTPTTQTNPSTGQ